MSNKRRDSDSVRQSQERYVNDDTKVKVKRSVIHFIMCVLAFCVFSNTILALGWFEYEGWQRHNFDFGYSFLNIFFPAMAILFLWLLQEDG